MTPEQELPVLDYIYDVRKVAGSSAEMFYKGGFPGYAFEAYPEKLDRPEPTAAVDSKT